MTKGIEIINNFTNLVDDTGGKAMRNKIQIAAAEAQMKIHDLHSRAIACHCECMGMNAENCIAASINQSPLYGYGDYSGVLTKWGLVDDDNKSII
jgi:hypothetical protein